jgi:hypothetical protein
VLIGYDFAIKYVKGQHNVVADALSRITIQELIELNNELNESTILVVTRLQKRLEIDKEKEKLQIENLEEMAKKPSGSRTDQRTEKPPVCEILSRPRGTILLKSTKIRTKESLRNIVILHYELRLHIILMRRQQYICAYLRAELERVSVLQDLVKLCRELKTKELVIMKNEKHESIIRLLKHVHTLLKDSQMRIYILKDVTAQW